MTELEPPQIESHVEPAFSPEEDFPPSWLSAPSEITLGLVIGLVLKQPEMGAAVSASLFAARTLYQRKVEKRSQK